MRPPTWDREADLVIVGSGYAGLAAAIEAERLGVSVIILEKMDRPGGNSLIARGGANAVDPERQQRQGIDDSWDLHFSQTMKGGDGINDPEKVRYMVEHALEGCILFLEDLGVAWPDKVIRGYGALYERTHDVPSYRDRNGRTWKRGAASVHAMLDYLRERGRHVLCGHAVTQIIREEPLAGRVTGVEIEAREGTAYIKAAKGVILATGGFGANLEWVTKHDRRLANTGTTNHPGAIGECIAYAQDVGADTLHMDYIQAIPHTGVRPPFKGMFYTIDSEEIRSFSSSLPYRIFVNANGNRFADEGGRRDVITDACLGQPLFEPAPAIRCSVIEEIESALGIPHGNLVKTISRYNAACAAKQDAEFGKDVSLLIPLTKPPFRAMSSAIQRHHTMGGLRVKGATGEVLDRSGVVIPGLYAAGEVTGGTHGANRVGHNATVDCIVFGRACARAAFST